MTIEIMWVNTSFALMNGYWLYPSGKMACEDSNMANFIGLTIEEYKSLLINRFNATIFHKDKNSNSKLYFEYLKDALRTRTFLNNEQLLNEYKNACLIMNKLT